MGPVRLSVIQIKNPVTFINPGTYTELTNRMALFSSVGFQSKRAAARYRNISLLGCTSSLREPTERGERGGRVPTDELDEVHLT